MPIHTLVDCTWPCPGGNDQACILNETSISCQPKQNSQWIWINPLQSPQYDGEPARLNQPCITIPLHHLPPPSRENHTTMTLVEWPPIDSVHPLDRYLSDCNQATYCEQGSCVPKLSPGDSCASTNQCKDSLCHRNICEAQQEIPSTNPPTQHQQKKPEGDSPWSNQPVLTTGHIVGVVIAGVVLLSAITIFFYCYRRRKQRTMITTSQKQQQRQRQEPPILPFSHLPPSPSPDVSDTTPSMQQQQLQFQLQQHHPPPSSSTPSGPPPYSP